MLKAIVARNTKDYIGKDGKMLWRSKEDFKHFKRTTMGGILIVGKTTFEKDLCGNTLPGRLMFVVGTGYMTPFEALSAAILESDGRKILNVNFNDTTPNLNDIAPGVWLHNEDIWLIGGSQMYEIFGPLVQEFHISNIVDNDAEGDVKFELPKNFRGKVFEYDFTCA